MKAAHMSLLLVVVLATSLANTQTTVECRLMIAEKANQINSDIQALTTSCGTSGCSSSCRSALNDLKNNIGCCLASYNGINALTFWDQCNIAVPTGCSSSSASGVIISVFTVGLVSMFSYIMN